MADVKELNINSTTYDIKAKSVVDTNTGSLKFWSGTKAQYNAIVTKDSKTQYICTDTGEIYLGDVQIGGGGASRNIGEIVASTLPLTDAGLHLLDGTLLNGSGAYSAFVDYIAGLVPTYPDLFVTEADWQTSVTTYGICGKFVYSVSAISSTITILGTTMTLNGTRRATSDMDAGSLGMRYAWYVPELSGDIFTTSTSPIVGDDIWIYENGTWSTSYGGVEPKIDEVTASIRLPKVTGILEGTTDVTALGDLVEAGLPNITGSFASAFVTTGTGCVSTPTTENAPSKTYGASSREHVNSISYIDASNSSSIYGNSTTVQPQTIKVLYYIVIATSTKTDIQVDIDEIATDLNGKADVDLTNVNNQGTIAIAHNAMPSNSYYTYTVGSSGSSYTAPADGYVMAAGTSTTSGVGSGVLYLESSSGLTVQGHGNQSVGLHIILPIVKNDTFTFIYHGAIVDSLLFYYAIGSESEAS